MLIYGRRDLQNRNLIGNEINIGNKYRTILLTLLLDSFSGGRATPIALYPFLHLILSGILTNISYKAIDILLYLYYNRSIVTTEKVTIKIPKELYQLLKQMIKDTGFSSVNEFIVFVMRTVASGSEMKMEDNLTAQEVKTIRDRLKKLGYI